MWQLISGRNGRASSLQTGKYLSLEEARKKGKLKQFIKEHDSKGDKKAFEDCLD